MARKLDTVAGLLDELAQSYYGQFEDTDALIMVFVPGDRGKGYRRIRRVRTETCEAPDGQSYQRVILYAADHPGD
jgi:hypothetical protein